MLTRYKNLVSSWETDMLIGDNFSGWAETMLLQWDAADPVSQKEIDRNNAIYIAQGNRNPFIDRPEFGQYVWDTSVFVETARASNIKWWYSNSTLYVNSNFHSTSVEILNMLGQQVHQATIVQVEALNLNLKPGIYLAVGRSDSATEVLRFVVQ